MDLLVLLFKRAKKLNDEFEIILDSYPLERWDERLSNINRQLEAIIVVVKGILDDRKKNQN